MAVPTIGGSLQTWEQWQPLSQLQPLNQMKPAQQMLKKPPPLIALPSKGISNPSPDPPPPLFFFF